MTTEELTNLVQELRAKKQEYGWVEFKLNNDSPETMGQNISALANSAALHEKEESYLIFGVNGDTYDIEGTTFYPEKTRVKGQELEPWMSFHLEPKLDFRFYECEIESKRVVVVVIPAAAYYIVKFQGTAYIRVGSYTKPLAKNPDKEKALWEKLNKKRFETEIAHVCASEDELLSLINYVGFFKLMNLPLPTDKEAIIQTLLKEKITQKKYGKYRITNLGAILFAEDLSRFDKLSRKAVRVIKYKGNNKIDAALLDHTGAKGYAVGFEGLVQYLQTQIPENEHLTEALRQNRKLYPPVAVREIVANALIHQDFSIEGTGPVIEIFDNRIEVTNPGRPLIPTDRFIDHAPTSRNEKLASMMRRVNICEERGSGIDRTVGLCEVYQLPAPDFFREQNYTRAIIYAPKTLRQMSKEDKIRAAYQHCALKYVANDGYMTNVSLRKRLNISDKNYPTASKIISDAIEGKVIKPYDPSLRANRHQTYIPYWG